MFGYVTVNRDALDPAQYETFRTYYCGLCHALHARHKNIGRMTLSNDMTFLYLVLSALHEPQTRLGKEACVARPVKKHAYRVNEIADYAADMNVLLAYYQSLDDARDEGSLAGRIGARALEKPFERVAARYPEIARTVRESIEALSELEKANHEGLDAPANAMGELVGAIYAYGDFCADTLREMGAAMGRYVYLLDAYCDLDRDRKSGSYNPFFYLAGDVDFEQKANDALTLMISDCANAFERLPILENANLIRNILYSGVWGGYALAKRKREKKP